jgi:histidine triad (HIT) family protein
MTSSQNIELPNDGPCAFCAYLSGARPYTILARTELVAVLVTREQRGTAHLLVVPIRHVPTILDINDEESDALMRAVRQAAYAIDQVEKSPGIAIWQNNGVPAAQAIGHLHFHVAGTLPGGGTDWGDVGELTVAETDSIAERLRREAPLDLK